MLCFGTRAGASLFEPSALGRQQVFDPAGEGAAKAADIVVPIDVGTTSAQAGCEGGWGSRLLKHCGTPRIL